MKVITWVKNYTRLLLILSMTLVAITILIPSVVSALPIGGNYYTAAIDRSALQTAGRDSSSYQTVTSLGLPTYLTQGISNMLRLTMYIFAAIVVLMIAGFAYASAGGGTVGILMAGIVSIVGVSLLVFLVGLISTMG